MPDRRGHHKIFLGMAAGVGKTFRMLQEGHAELDSGRDIVVGVVETHGRADTAALLAGLEILPRRQVDYRDTAIEEMDLPAILLRAPEVCLIDELAHTNAPGLEHDKRYEDIEDVLVAGIDVISTVNVQHLDSLNDRIAELTGITIRETFPDRVLSAADEVVLIDISPEALLDRLRAGKVYPSARIDAALNNFFRIETLAALREIALREVAEEVETKRTDVEISDTRSDLVATQAPQAVSERLLALVKPHPSCQRLVRRAWRSAQRLGSDLDLLWVKPPGATPSAQEEAALAALRQLAAMLGATLLIEDSDDVPGAIARVARQRGTTYILLGRSRPIRGLRRPRVPLPQQLIERLPGVDVRIVADRARRYERRP